MRVEFVSHLNVTTMVHRVRDAQGVRSRWRPRVPNAATWLVTGSPVFEVPGLYAPKAARTAGLRSEHRNPAIDAICLRRIRHIHHVDYGF